MNDCHFSILPITRGNGFKQLRNLVCPAKHSKPAFSDHINTVDNSVQQVCFLTLLSHPDNIWLDSLLAIDARMLVLRATRTWAGAFLEASSRGNAHNTHQLCCHQHFIFSWWTRMISFPSPVAPQTLWPFMLVGERGGGGHFTHQILCQETLGFSKSGVLQDRILFSKTVR